MRKVGEHTFELAQQFVDRMVRVDTDAICAAIKDVLKTPVPSWSPPVPWHCRDETGRGRAHLAGRHLVAVACGANMNFDRLRFTAERAELGEERSDVAVEIPESPGSLRRLCELLRERSLTEFSIVRPMALRRRSSSVCR